MKKVVMFLVVFAIGAGVAIAAGKEEFAPGKVDLAGLQALIKESKESESKLVLIDSRGGKYFDNEVIEGAKHLSVADQTPEKLSEIVPDRNTKIVFYCSNTACMASELAGYKAKMSGYEDVHKFPGGIKEWKDAGLPTTRL